MTTNTNTATSARTSTLARLLATENLRIAHDPNLPSAAFDGKTRTLYLPQWRVDKQTYDMLVGHEVAHAKYTDFAQWTEAEDRLAKTKNQKAVVHDFINVVEDARIDRLIKRDYPGLRPDYKHGYGVLNEMDLFKIKGRSITVEDRLIDRINLHYKVGIHCGMTIPFTDEERTILDRINACSDGEKDFAKIVKIAEELYLREKAEMEEGKDGGEGEGESEESDEGKSKKSKKSKKGKKSESKKGKGKKGEKGEDQDGSETDGEDQDGEESDGDESDGEGEGEGEESDGEGEGEGEESDDEDGNGEGKEAAMASSEPSDASDEEYEPQMVNTAAAGRTGLQSLVDSSIVEQQIEIRPIDASKIVVETAEFMSMFDEQCRVDHHIHNSSSPEKTRVLDAESMKAFRRVKDENKKSVDLMCRRFEVRRSARNFAKTTSQKSGRISPRLLKNYRFSEDIFDRMTVRSDEKNHGIVILLDWSGSMQGIIRESVSQLVATVEFCRRVGIPVQVYFFSSIYNKAVLDEVVRRNPSVNRKEMLANVAMGYIPATGKVWSEEICNNIFNEIVCGTTPQDIMEGKASHCSMFSLFKVYDSAAGQRKMVASLGRLILLSDAVGKFSRSRRVTIDHGPLSLGGTPLDESILAMRDIVNDFRKSSNTKVTLISITDGEGQSLINRVHSPYVGSKTLSRVIVDKETGRRFDLKDFNSTTHSAVVQMFKDATGARIVGIRLESREGSNYRLSYSTPWWWQEGSWDCADAEKNKREAAEKKYAKDKFLSLEIPVYDGYCLVAIVEDSQAEKMAEKAEAKGLAAKTIQTRQKNLEKSFMAAMRQKQANRLFINTLMDVVAK